MPPTIEERIEETRKFIKALWGICPKDWIVEIDLLQYRPTEANPDDKRMLAIFHTVDQALTNWTQIHAELEQRNRKEVENIHHAVLPRHRRPKKHGKNSDVSHYIALWIDVDFHGQETSIRKLFNETIEELTAIGLAPSVVIESGRGLHAYWLLDKPYTVEEARPMCAGLQKHFQISDAVHDPRRVLRLPGFLNLKEPKDPKWCKVVGGNWERYKLEAFKDYAVEPGMGEEEKEDEEIKEGAKVVFSRDPKIEKLKAEGVTEGEGAYGGRHNGAVALAGHYCAKGIPKKSIAYTMRIWNEDKNNPPIDEDELERIIEDIWIKDQVRRAEEGPQKKEKEKSPKEKAKEKRAHQPWFDEEGNFNVAVLAQWFMREHSFLSTPISSDGRGVALYRYDNGVFKEDGDEFVRSEASRHIGSLATDGHLNEVVMMVHEYSKIRYHEINRKALDVINFRNCMLEWRTGKILEHSPDYKSVIQMNVDYEPDAKSEDLDKFFNEVFPDDCVALVEEFMGYLLIPSTSLQKAFVAIGSGGNGKGTFLKILTHMLNEDNVSTISLHQIQEDKFAAAGLMGKLCNCYHDLDPNILKSTGKFKSIVSGDPISAERKYKDHYTFTPFSRLVFSANEFPRSSDKTEAYFDRLIFVEFPNKFRGQEGQILDYDSILINKPKLMSAFLNRAIAGLRRLMKNQKFTASKTSSKAIETYKRECSNAFDFLSEHCVRELKGEISKKELYSKYNGWCGDQGMRPVSAKNFAKSVRELATGERKSGSVRLWVGIKWGDDGPPETGSDEVKMFRTGPDMSQPPGSDF